MRFLFGLLLIVGGLGALAWFVLALVIEIIGRGEVP